MRRDGSSSISHNRALVGRSPDSDVVIDFPEVSRNHALIYRQDGQAYAADLGSSNGTWIDGIRIGSVPHPINTVASINLGKPSPPVHAMPELILTILRLIFLALVYLFIWQVARAISRHLGFGQNRTARKTGKQIAVVRSDTQAGMTFAVNGATVVGRSDQSDVQIEDPYASEFHFRLVNQDGTLTVSDLGSTNGTYVNGRRITTPTNLRRGDALQVGKTVMEVR